MQDLYSLSLFFFQSIQHKYLQIRPVPYLRNSQDTRLQLVEFLTEAGDFQVINIEVFTILRFLNLIRTPTFWFHTARLSIAISFCPQHPCFGRFCPGIRESAKIAFSRVQNIHKSCLWSVLHIHKHCGSCHFSTIHPRFKPRNLAHFVMVTNCVLKTMAEIDKHGNIRIATFTKDLVLPMIGVEKHPSPSSALSEQETTPERALDLEFACVGEVAIRQSTERATVNPIDTYGIIFSIHCLLKMCCGLLHRLLGGPSPSSTGKEIATPRNCAWNLPRFMSQIQTDVPSMLFPWQQCI
jgi:hypothetical protein